MVGFRQQRLEAAEDHQADRVGELEEHASLSVRIVGVPQLMSAIGPKRYRSVAGGKTAFRLLTIGGALRMGSSGNSSVRALVPQARAQDVHGGRAVDAEESADAQS